LCRPLRAGLKRASLSDGLRLARVCGSKTGIMITLCSRRRVVMSNETN
jgi:hypothetical protein